MHYFLERNRQFHTAE